MRDENKNDSFGKKTETNAAVSSSYWSRKETRRFCARKGEEHEKMGNRTGGTSADGGDARWPTTAAGLDNERAQAVYWEYSGAVIEDYAEVESQGRTFAFILFKQEQRRW